jgi:hypothetical protein
MSFQAGFLGLENHEEYERAIGYSTRHSTIDLRAGEFWKNKKQQGDEAGMRSCDCAADGPIDSVSGAVEYPSGHMFAKNPTRQLTSPWCYQDSKRYVGTEYALELPRCLYCVLFGRG